MRITIFVAGFMLFGVRADGQETESRSTIKIGVSAPLSGDLAEYGAAVRNGIELARAEAPEQSESMTFLFEDNRYEAAKAVTAFNKLVSLDKVSLVFNWGEPTLAAVAPLAERRKTPLLAMSLDPAPASGKKFVVLTINFAEQYAEKLTSYLRSRGIRSIAVVQTDDPFLNSMVDGIRHHLQPGETLQVVATIKPGDADFRTQILKLKDSQFDAVGVYLFSGQVSTFFRQAQSLGLQKVFFGTDFFESRAEIQQSGSAMEGAIYPNLQVPADFVKRYTERFGSDAQIAYAYNAYEFARVSLKLFSSSRGALPAEEIIALYSKGESSEAFSLDKTPAGATYFRFPLVIRRIRRGTFEDIE